eukprot:TRINITY_DN7832_c0_g1_i1.p1 TRINITY_DN7832_c0_g1~~TRINITY_DN7832_c0_g1_i1.p1  ORF type:complete len:437 (-),score=41.62 TRINITY_DN7832_c0_g1_i1:495-1805(-)
MTGSLFDACEVQDVHDAGFAGDLEGSLHEQGSGRWALLLLFCFFALFRMPLAHTIDRMLSHWDRRRQRGLWLAQFLQVLTMDALLLYSLFRGQSSTQMSALLIALLPALSAAEAIVSMHSVKGDWDYSGMVVGEADLAKTWTECQRIPLPDFLKPPARPWEDLRFRWKPRNVYSDFSADFVRVLCIFVAQTMLVALVILYFREKEFFATACGIRATFLFLCTLVLQIVAESQGGGRFVDELGMWSFLYSAFELYESEGPEQITCPLYRDGDRGCDEDVRCSQSQQRRRIRNRKGSNLHESEVLARGLMSFLVNGVAYDFFIYFMPLILAASESTLEFVLNAFAVFFVVQMDDITATTDPVLLDDTVRYLLDIPTSYWPHHESYEHGVVAGDESNERAMRHPFLNMAPLKKYGNGTEDGEGGTGSSGSDEETQVLMG